MPELDPPVVQHAPNARPSGLDVEPIATHSINIEPTTSGKKGLLASRTAILGLLFFVTGALGLPFLWMSPSFSTTEKWIWSVVNVIYTIVLLSLTALVLWWSWSQISRTFASTSVWIS